MITLHILQYLVQLGFLQGVDIDAFDERMPLNKYGVSIYSVGDDMRVSNTKIAQMFELECRHATDYRAAKDKLEKIAMALRSDHPCVLPEVPGVSIRTYKNCNFDNISNVQNIGDDASGRTIFKITGRIVYNKI